MLLAEHGLADKQRGSIAQPVLLTLAGILVVALLAVGATLAWLYPQLPPLDKVLHYEPRQPLQVFTRDGVELAQFGPERRQFEPISQIPLLMQNAVIAVEDARFRDHGGIDLHGIVRAAVADLTGGMRQGASTITQQVARTFFLSSRRTAERKLKEALLALKIERQLGKDQILELYMNQIYLGHHAYGFAAAAEVYFGKPLGELSIAETAMLAGLPQNPAYANPISNFERARQRQALVLARMRAAGVIDDAQLAAAQAEKLRIRSSLQPGVHAEYVAEMARQAVYERYGEQAYLQGFKVYTSLISTDQEAAYQALRHGVLDYDRRHPYTGPEDNEALPESIDGAELAQAAGQALEDYRDDEDLRVALVTEASPREVTAQLATGETVRIEGDGLRWVQPALAAKAATDLAIRRGAVIRVIRTDHAGGDAGSAEARWAVTQWPDADAAFVSLDPATGRVRALVGGFSFADQPFNHVLQAWRQPGSSFKPFLFSAALEHGLTPATIINDAPLEQAASGVPGGWDPKDAEAPEGPMTMREALAKSKNLVSIRIVEAIGLKAAREWSARFGFDIDKQPDNLTIALGAGSTTPLQLAGAYAVFANGGHRVTPVIIERITDAQGKLLFEAPAPPALDEGNRVIPERNAFVTNSMLQEVTRSGTAARAQQVLKRPDLFGKTGTTNDAFDAWFAGFQPSVVGVAWMGYDTPQSLGAGEYGGGVALPIWIGYMQQVLKGVPVVTPAPPAGVTRRDDDWVYSESADGGATARIGVDDPGQAAAAASAPDAAASAAIEALFH